MYKVGLFPMVADLFHPGHISALREAKKHCDKLIVALNVNPTGDNSEKNKPIQTVFERYYQLISCKYVDEVIPYDGEDDLLSLIQITDYNIRFIGEDHREYWTGMEYEKAHNIEVCIATRCNIHTASLRKRITEGK